MGGKVLSINYLPPIAFIKMRAECMENITRSSAC